MYRRDFLRASVPALALASLAAAGCGGGSTSPATEQSGPRFPPLNFLPHHPGFSDYRPAVDATGDQVVFERTPHGDDTRLHVFRSISAPTPVAELFLPAVQAAAAVPSPASQTRPDWCWVTGRVALNGAPSNTAQVQVYLAEADGRGLELVPHSHGFLYPTWIHDGTRLVVYNNSVNADPVPCTSLIQLDGTVLLANLNGRDAAGDPVFGGFAAPNPGDPTRIAFAGQPVVSSWGPEATADCPDDPSGYNQCYNYPFLNSSRGGFYTSSPLELGASISTFEPSYQGRAPSWSPDGRHLVFESDRAGGYAIFLVDVTSGHPPVQVTDASWGAQHAKFFPSGDRLILTALQEPDTAGPRGIAWVDLSSFLR